MDALQAAAAKAPDVLISDVVMPQFSGIELAVRIREFAPQCKVMLLSGQALTASLLENSQAGSNDFEILLKPMHPRELVSRLQKAVG
jgi:CheY-like chemotaxis protein